ncbi:MAG: family 78 glycoside hydrolase catalytic domain, partial [Clostridia bacterium]
DTALYPRPLPKLVLDAPVPGRLCTQGIFRWRDGDTVAQRMQHAWLSTCPRTEVWRDGVISPTPKDADGCYFLFDLGREEAGIFTLEVEGEAGAKLFVAYGEHLEDLRVRAFVGNRNFAFS